MFVSRTFSRLNDLFGYLRLRGLFSGQLECEKSSLLFFYSFFRPLQMEYAGMARYPQMYGSMGVQQQSPREKAVMVRDSFQANVI